MSSKLYAADDPQPFGPLVWRQVGASGPLPEPAGAAPAPEPGEELAARLEQLEVQWRQKVRAARAAGVSEGEAAGRARATAEFQPVVERLCRSIEELAHLRARLRREAESDVVQLALAIARRVVRRELATDPEALHGLVMVALEKLQGQEIARVKVHPSHVALVTACLRQATSGGLVEVVPDPTREVGAVVFETERGNLDASVDSQLREIERGLADRLRKQP